MLANYKAFRVSCPSKSSILFKITYVVDLKIWFMNSLCASARFVSRCLFVMFYLTFKLRNIKTTITESHTVAPLNCPGISLVVYRPFLWIFSKVGVWVAAAQLQDTKYFLVMGNAFLNEIRIPCCYYYSSHFQIHALYWVFCLLLDCGPQCTQLLGSYGSKLVCTGVKPSTFITECAPKSIAEM